MKRLSQLCFVMLVAGCGCEDDQLFNPDDVTVEPAVLDFGVVVVGSECQRPITIANASGATVDFASYEIPADQGGDVFSVVPFTMPGQLFAAQTNTAGSVLYSPTVEDVQDNGLLKIAYAVGDRSGQKEVALTGYVVASRSPRVRMKCPDIEGPCPQLLVDGVQRGQSLHAVVEIENLGTEVLSLSNVQLRSESGNWTVQQAYFGIGPNDSPIELPAAGGDPVEVKNAVQGDCGDEEGFEDARSLKVELQFHAQEVGLDTATLVVESNDPFNPVVELPLNGVGQGQRALVTPPALNFGTEAEIQEVKIESIGNTPFPINATYVDIDGDGERGEDEPLCRPGERTADDGLFSCSSARGGGFRLSGTDATEGGDDEAVIRIFYFPTDGATVRAALRLESTALGIGDPGTPGVFTVPLGAGGSGRLSVYSPETASDRVVIGYAADPDDETRIQGASTFVVENEGDIEVTVDSVRVLQNNQLLPENDRMAQNFTVTEADDNELSLPFTLAASETKELKVVFDRENPGVELRLEAQLGFFHDGVSANPALMLVQVQPAE